MVIIAAFGLLKYSLLVLHLLQFLVLQTLVYFMGREIID